MWNKALKLKEKNIDLIVENINLQILNDPQLIMLKLSVINGSFEYAPFEFTLQQFVGPEIEWPLGEVKYELTQIINFCEDTQSFEMVSKHNDTWKGLADNEEIETKHQVCFINK